MRALSIRPPWAWAIMHAGKDIENRTWKTNFRGTFAVHASAYRNRSYHQDSVRKILQLNRAAHPPAFEDITYGAIVGVVDLVDCRQLTKSKWHLPDNFGFLLANPRLLTRPIPCSGSLSFWHVPDEIAKKIVRQVGRESTQSAPSSGRD